jgi:TatD DNase family protein
MCIDGRLHPTHSSVCHVWLRRLQFCPADVQRKWFARQFDLVRDSGLPVFLHMRAAADDMLKILQQKRGSFSAGVVHSFDGTLQEAHSILSLQGLCIGAYITLAVGAKHSVHNQPSVLGGSKPDVHCAGINGCSLKTVENLQVVAQLPADRLLLETGALSKTCAGAGHGFMHMQHELTIVFNAADSPWCEPRPTHASRQHIKSLPAAVDKKKYDPGKLVKGRNEPGSGMRQVLEIVASVQQKVRIVWDDCLEGN